WYGAVDALCLIAIAIYKAETSPRLHAPNGVPALMWSILTNLFRRGFKPGQYGLNLPAAFEANYWDYLLGLPRTVLSLQWHHPLAGLWLAATAFGLFVFFYLRRIPFTWSSSDGFGAFVVGVLVFLAGYAMFLTNKAIQITPTGIGNRTSIAASLGVAISAVGALAIVACLVESSNARTQLFALLVSAHAAAGFFVLSEISSFWIDAYHTELQVADDIVTHSAPLAPHSTLLLGGICSYHGPGIIYEADWDLAGALRLRTGDVTLSADVLRPTFSWLT